MLPDKFYIMQTDDAKDLPLPEYMSRQAAGLDLYANVHSDTVLRPGDIMKIPTGIKIALPNCFEAQIRPRSGLALNNGISMPNSPGTVDADFRGELNVILINLGKEDFVIKRAMRIAQMVINKIEQITWTVADKLPPTERGEGGYGHTGC